MRSFSATHLHTHTCTFGELLVTFVFVLSALCWLFACFAAFCLCIRSEENDKPTVADPAQPWIHSATIALALALSLTPLCRSALAQLLLCPLLLLSNLHSHCAVAVMLFECNSNWRIHSRVRFYVSSSSSKNKDSRRGICEILFAAAGSCSAAAAACIQLTLFNVYLLSVA